MRPGGDAYKPAMDIPTRLELLNEGEIPAGIDDPATWAARLLEWRRDHGLDPTLDAGVWLAWADWSLSRLRYRAAYADAQAALDKLEADRSARRGAEAAHRAARRDAWTPLGRFPRRIIVKYLTVSADCTKESRDLLSVEWDEGKLGEPTAEAVLKALRNDDVMYDVVDEDWSGATSFNGVEVLEAEDE